MGTPPLSTALRHLHVKLRLQVSEMKVAFSMSSLRTFTFVKALRRQFFNDARLADVQYAFILNDDQSHSDLD